MNDKVEGQGRAVTLPNGELRIEFIRNAYYGKDGAHGEGCKSRSEIKNEINAMYPEGTDGQIPYQIVFAATKEEVDPRIAATERAAKRAEAKVAKDAEKAAEKAAAAEAKAKAAKAAPAKDAKAKK